MRFKAGDMVVMPGNNTNLVTFSATMLHLQEVLNVPVNRWVATLNKKLGAGFYSSVWGPLPFATGSSQPELHHIFMIVSPGESSPQ